MNAANVPYAALLLAGYAVFTLWCYRTALLSWWQNRQQHHSLHDVLIGYGSESGNALALARSLRQQLVSQGQTAQLINLNKIAPAQLTRDQRLLIITSTTGDGEAPANAERFFHNLSSSGDSLQCEFALLALGDRLYSNFCAFGHQLSQQLKSLGARPLFPVLEVDRLCPQTIEHWYELLGASGFPVQAPKTSTRGVEKHEPFPQRWALKKRTLLNHGSPGNAMYELELSSPLAAHWQAGDTVLINITGQQREYSIASTPAEDCLRLLVRMQYYDDGSPGLGCGYLCETISERDVIELQLKRNPACYDLAMDMPMILIGNGTGLAGLRAQIQQRLNSKQHGDMWLIYGERSAEHDRPWHQQLNQWHSNGDLTALNFAFSRSHAPWPPSLQGKACEGYVQQILKREVLQLKQCLAKGAVIYLCGSRDGMGSDTDRTLRELIGSDYVDELELSGRYVRDVY